MLGTLGRNMGNKCRVQYSGPCDVYEIGKISIAV